MSEDLHVLVPVEVGTLKEGDEFYGEFGATSVWKRFEDGVIQANNGAEWDQEEIVYVRKSISPEVMDAVEHGVRKHRWTTPGRMTDTGARVLTTFDVNTPEDA